MDTWKIVIIAWATHTSWKTVRSVMSVCKKMDQKWVKNGLWVINHPTLGSFNPNFHPTVGLVWLMHRSLCFWLRISLLCHVIILYIPLLFSSTWLTCLEINPQVERCISLTQNCCFAGGSHADWHCRNKSWIDCLCHWALTWAAFLYLSILNV